MRNFIGTLSRRITVPLAVIFIASAVAYGQTPPGKSNIGFLYAFGAYAGPQGKGKVVSVQNETSLRAGDRLKLFFEPRSDLHFYLVHVSSQGELTTLFPAEGKPAKVAAGTQVFIPAGNNWFELDAHPGQEKFFLIATAERLDRLEELCSRHTALKDKADVQSSTDAILDEIKGLRQKHRQLSAPAEKPVRIGGSVRGQQPSSSPAVPDITPLAAEVTAPGFYTRTFSIEHR
ncbi:MAG: DUF4384 domain-containing protein [Deltaproteobacteria bacterium]|nr:DUF4384 domain-containing protein [Deltaproteobacteria bacterium]